MIKGWEMKVLSFRWIVNRGQQPYMVYLWELETQSEGTKSDIPNHMALSYQLDYKFKQWILDLDIFQCKRSIVL